MSRAKELAEKLFEMHQCEHCDDGPCDTCLKYDVEKAIRTAVGEALKEAEKIADDSHKAARQSEGPGDQGNESERIRTQILNLRLQWEKEG